MFIHDIASYLVNLTKQDVKPDIYSVFDLPGENRCPANIESEKLTILEILNAIGCRLKNLFGFVKINTTTETIDEGEAVVNVNGDVDNLNFDFKIPRGKTGPQGPAGPGIASGGTTGQVLAKKSNANFDTEWINNSGGGSTVSVNVGKTTTGEPGTNASVTNSGDESNVVLNFTIPRGDTGKTGPQGPAGPGIASGGTTGQVLAKKSNANFDTEWINNSGGGSTVSVNVGKTTTGEPGTNASVTNSGDESNVVLNFTIPRGDTGKTGPQGPAGPGIASGGTTGQVLAKKSNANFDTEWINNSGGGSTVSVNVGETLTGEPGSNASVTNSGDESNVVLNFTIPRGDTGKTGPQGPAGPGIASGGTTGQVLAKKSNANFDTEWINNSGGGSTVSVNVGETLTGEPGSNASVTNSGDESNVVLNFTIPRGDTGPAGPGVAAGGTTGQVLAKKSNTNFDTEWIDNSGGGSAFTKTVLWKNNSPTSAFESQTITTTENGFDYPLLIIEFSETASSVSKLSVMATNTTKFGTNSTLLSYYQGYRTIRTQTGTTWSVSAGFNLSTNVTDNNEVIPLNIIGYK
jgi:hypothetical protein